MDLKFTTKSQEAISAAVQQAASLGNAHVEPPHLLSALLGQGEGISLALLTNLGVNLADLANAVEQQLRELPSASGSSVSAPQLSNTAYQVLNDAQALAAERDDEFISTEHILIALAQSDTEGPLLTDSGATPVALLDALASLRGSGRVTTPDPEGTFQALDKIIHVYLITRID